MDRFRLEEKLSLQESKHTESFHIFPNVSNPICIQPKPLQTYLF